MRARFENLRKAVLVIIGRVKRVGRRESLTSSPRRKTVTMKVSYKRMEMLEWHDIWLTTMAGKLRS